MNKKIKFFQSINFKIALVFILLLLVTVEIIGAYFVKSLEQQNIDTFKTSINLDPYLQDKLATDLMRTDTDDANGSMKSTISQADIANTATIVVVDAKGTVRANSNVNAQGDVGTKSANNNIKNVLYNGQIFEGYEYASNTGSMYTRIIPIKNPSATGEGNAVIGAVSVTASMETVYHNINQIVRIFLIASLVAGMLGVIISIVISRAITRPIEEMKKQAIRMARGDYSGQVRIYGQDELGQLAVAVNNLSVRVEEAQEASEAERRRLDSVLAHMTDGVIATDRRGNVIIINETALDFLNTKNEDVIGVSILRLLNIEKDYTLRDLLENQKELLLDFSQQLNHELILRVDFSLIQRETGFISGLVAVLHDVTEQQKDERERREFVSNVSHELRTPLTSMRSYIEALSDGAWQDPEIAPQFLKVTQDETDRMIRMINDLLSLSRMDSGTSKIELEYVNLNEFFNYILDRFDMMLKTDNEQAGKDNNQSLPAHATHKQYSIRREITKRDLWVEIDQDKFMQVIDNIMNNAIKYSPDGGVISARLLETHNHVILSISDQGLGIPRQDINKVFDRFYRVDKARSRQQGGTGLGLAISKEVIEVLGGRIWVDSQEGKGSTFYISLPYQPLDEDGGDWDEA
ncbi:MAG: cell wall metabolism sensor histidine kinase WalK [Lactobacillus sp.]|jgi:two-component system sensor histidine kinase VicK|uniref:histidine kinase n=1 Tax=Lacticaseibacillus suilingensis TaxID=2799577 RepID=A0ABW4BG87_9LACO|nr:cell wall metabolism sensor histidine kinase WalK [Lacticaseibacillus suilingensis]MCI1894282.1 cell wall metabolism sensor histidine kinase WalK [Lactobacillus sp.]MCI1916873.1 cell wall metabolism sensor histidine kinase WalK [Lactobacillus sp.]MCI1942077.1 cell wall metabolism sensor histidine kinase WalK [Lactobacillus sp.]MCI1972460.1 cell wall metabolism sensor histidine kinase WalK [Lactobacillus sp.]MCI2037499.1 cell wall metabolism sensor histidine kinase WalK [Lactobacillus sp.]